MLVLVAFFLIGLGYRLCFSATGNTDRGIFSANKGFRDEDLTGLER